MRRGGRRPDSGPHPRAPHPGRLQHRGGPQPNAAGDPRRRRRPRSVRRDPRPGTEPIPLRARLLRPAAGRARLEGARRGHRTHTLRRCRGRHGAGPSLRRELPVAQPFALTIPWMRYDLTMALLDGRAPIDGVTVAPSRTVPNGTNVPADGPIAQGDFHLVDLNVCNWLPAIEAGWELTALPIFTKRKPVYQYIFCRADLGIQAPRDLEGKRIGIRRYRISTTIWQIGLLEQFHGLDRSRLHWVVSLDALTDPFGAFIYPDADVELARDPQRPLLNQLLDGEVDALMMDVSDRALFAAIEHDPRVQRLFPDYEAEELRLYRATGIVAPAHILAMSKRLDRQRPELAGQIYRAAERAKAIALEENLSERGTFSVAFLRERVLEQEACWGDPFKLGITASQPDIDAWIRYNVEQGMIHSPLTYQDIFAASTLAS